MSVLIGRVYLSLNRPNSQNQSEDYKHIRSHEDSANVDSVAQLLSAAQSGDVHAMFELGRRYNRGDDIAQDQQAAIHWLRQASDNDHLPAARVLGTVLLKTGQKDAIVEAKSLLQSTAERGDMKACAWLGWVALTDDYGDPDYAMARRWLEKAASLGHSRSMGNLGWMYSQGLGVPRDQEEAFRWYHKGALLGDVSSMGNLGWLYSQGLGVQQDDEEAFDWFSKTAEMGDAHGMHSCGCCYRDGKGVKQNDAETVRCFLESAAGGYVEGMYDLGMLFIEGKGVRRNPEFAREWFEKAAHLGSASAMYNLAVVTIELNGKPSRDEANAWLQKAKEAGWKPKSQKQEDFVASVID